MSNNDGENCVFYQWETESRRLPDRWGLMSAELTRSDWLPPAGGAAASLSPSSNFNLHFRFVFVTFNSIFLNRYVDLNSAVLYMYTL